MALAVVSVYISQICIWGSCRLLVSVYVECAFGSSIKQNVLPCLLEFAGFRCNPLGTLVAFEIGRICRLWTSKYINSEPAPPKP